MLLVTTHPLIVWFWVFFVLGFFLQILGKIRKRSFYCIDYFELFTYPLVL